MTTSKNKERKNKSNLTDTNMPLINSMPEFIFVHGSYRQNKIYCLIKNNGYSFIDVDILFRGKYLRKIIRTLKAIKYAKSHRAGPRYIISDGTSRPLFFAYLIAAASGHPLIVRIRGDNWSAQKTEFRRNPSLYRQLGDFLQERIDDFVLPRAKLIIAVSTFLHDKVKERFNLPEERCAVLAVPLTSQGQEATSTSVSRQTTGRFILMATNFEFWEKCGVILNCLPDITLFLNKYGDVKILIAGDGSHLARIKSSILGKPIADKIIFTGKVENMSNLYRESSAFVHLSHLDAFPNVVVEAQAAGLPTVVNNFPGITEALTLPGGTIVDEAVPGELFAALDLIFADPAVAVVRGATSREETLRRFSPEAIAAQFRRIVEERLISAS